MRVTGLSLLIVLASLARPTSAGARCEDQTCVTTQLSPDGLSATAVSHCGMSVHCNICPTVHGGFDLSKCVGADVDPGADSTVRFALPASRVVAECFDASSMSQCGIRRKQKRTQVRPQVRRYAPPAPARCVDQACVSTQLSSNGNSATVASHCGATVHCSVCPTRNGAFDLTQCIGADLDPGTDRAIPFAHTAGRVVTECFDARSADRCAIDRPRRERRDHGPAAPTVFDGWAGAETGKFTFELLAVADGMPSTSSPAPGVSASGLFLGAGIRLAIQAMGAPDHPGPETSWLGVRAGLGIDAGVAMATSSIQEPGLTPTSQTVSAFGWDVPLFVGVQTSLGSFDSATQWTGWTLGLDYQPHLTGAGIAPVGFNLHLASAEYQPRAKSSMHSHLDLNFFLIAPVNASLTLGGSIGVQFQ